MTANIDNLSPEQRTVFDIVVGSVESEEGQLFSLNACGGAGKTQTINMILHYVRSTGRIALATALSGIAATLLDGGRTLY